MRSITYRCLDFFRIVSHAGRCPSARLDGDWQANSKGASTFGLFGKKKAAGAITSIEFNGAGPNSVRLEFVLGPVHQTFSIGMDTPRQRYFEIFEIATAAMWDARRAEIAYRKKSGDNALLDIRVI